MSLSREAMCDETRSWVHENAEHLSESLRAVTTSTDKEAFHHPDGRASCADSIDPERRCVAESDPDTYYRRS